MLFHAPRSVRNNNPGNLNASLAWHGLMPRLQMNPAQLAETRFAVFQSPAWGFRALGIVLVNYQRVHGLKTPAGIIGRFAPPEENNTEAYVAVFVAALGVASADAEVDLLGTKGLLEKAEKAIAVHEAGGWFFRDEDLEAGVKLALESFGAAGA